MPRGQGGAKSRYVYRDGKKYLKDSGGCLLILVLPLAGLIWWML